MVSLSTHVEPCQGIHDMFHMIQGNYVHKDLYKASTSQEIRRSYILLSYYVYFYLNASFMSTMLGGKRMEEEGFDLMIVYLS